MCLVGYGPIEQLGTHNIPYYIKYNANRKAYKDYLPSDETPTYVSDDKAKPTRKIIIANIFFYYYYYFNDANSYHGHTVRKKGGRNGV